jgi:DNA-binding response OmpR family regulator
MQTMRHAFAEHDLPDTAGAAGRPLRVLVVEDEELVGLYLELSLRELGHVVVGRVADEGDALLGLARHRPDVVMTDIDLGSGGDGLVIARLARELFDVPAVVVTGMDDGETYLRAEETGAAAFLRKPFGFSQLTAVFDQVRPD